MKSEYVNTSSAVSTTIITSIIIKALSISFVANSAEINSDEEQQNQLEHIEVTAQKRSQNIQSVPVSITALNGNFFSNSNITNMVDAAEKMPNVAISGQSSMPQVYMRGIGAGVNYGFEQSVASFKDNIYLGRAMMLRAPLFDVERVEVLKGAQSIMFGKNATAGVISTITKNAVDDTEGYVTLRYGTDNTYGIEGAFNIALNDQWSLRVAGMSKSTDGFMDNALSNDNIRGVEQLDSVENNGARITLNGELDNGLLINFKAEYSNSDFGLSSRQTYVDTKAFAAATDLGIATGLTALLPQNATIDYVAEMDDSVGNQPLFNDYLKNNTYVLKLDYPLGKNEVTSISSYQSYHWNNAYDPTYSPQHWVTLNRTENFDQFTQELRLVSPEAEAGNFDYIIGGFYTKQNLDIIQNADIFEFPSIPFPGSQYGLLSDWLQEQWSIAAFSSIGWQVNQRLKLTLGLRFDKETKEVRSLQSTYTDDFATPSNLPPANSFFYADRVLGSFGAGNHNLKETRTENHFSPSLNVTYQLNQDVMAYGSATIGHKGGGFDGSVLNSTGIVGSFDDAGKPYNHFNPATIPSSSFEYEDEKATAFETGLKTDILGGQGRLNFAYYYTQFDDMQVSSFDGTNYVVDNAASSTVQGLELDASFNVSEHWQLITSAAYLDFSYDSFTNAPSTVWQSKVLGQAAQDLSGKRGIYAPEFSSNITINYETEFSGKYRLIASVDILYSSSFYTASDLDAQAKQDAFSKFNFRLDFADAIDEKWQFNLLIKNITNEKVIRTSQDNPGNSFAYWVALDPPRTYTLSATYNF